MHTLLSKNQIVSYIAATCILLTSFTFYVIVSRNLPIGYWDEIIYLSRSYYGYFWFTGDIHNPIWSTHQAYEQTKLALYGFYAWLYPGYILERTTIDQIDYILYLIKNGLEFNPGIMTIYEDYKMKHSFMFHETDYYSLSDYLLKYGPAILPPLKLVYFGRIFSAGLLSLSLLFGFKIIRMVFSLKTAVIFLVSWGLNTLVLSETIRTTTESMLLFTFNLGLYLFLKQILTGNIKHLYAFCIAAGLSTGAKLSGAILIIIYYVYTIQRLFVNSKRRLFQIFITLFLSLCIYLVVLLIIEPALILNPIFGIKRFIDRRNEILREQIRTNPSAYLSDPMQRFDAIIEKYYFQPYIPYYNGILGLEVISQKIQYTWLIRILAIVGILGITRDTILYKRIASKAFLIAATVTLVCLLQLLYIDWHRYYLLLSLFIIGIQSYGLIILLTFIYNLYYQKLIRNTLSNHKLLR